MSDVTRNLGKTLGIRERTLQMGLFTPKWMSNDLAKLLRAFRRLRTLLESGEIEEAKVIIDHLIEDTETDIQA